MKHSLEIYHNRQLVFQSDGKWLHPLFELENYLTESDFDPADLLVKDKIIGRAAALILIHLGFRRVYAAILSEPGKAALEQHQVQFAFKQLVPRILCRTESLLKNESSPDKAYQIVSNLRKK
ncbi:MAG TPA: DUF1893 domain-containing protein [bacterium]|nr:DUF1893 domain-containing protein [bacterium]